MGYQLVIGGDEQVPLASSSGWADVRAWSDDLVDAEYPELLQLIDNSLSQNLPRLEADVTRALQSHPADPDVVTTLQNLSQVLASRPPDVESVMVTDGFGPDDGEELWSSGFDEDEPTAMAITLAQVPIPRQGFKVPDTAQVLNAGLREFDRLFDELITAMSKRASQSTLGGIRKQIVTLEAELRTVGRLLGMLSPWQPRAVTYAGGQVPKKTEALPVTLADNAYKFPWIEDAVAFLESKGVVTTEQFAKMAEADRVHVFSAPGIDTTKQLKSIQTKLAKSLADGDDLRTFRKSIEADVALTRSQTETMYRTETKRGYVAGLDKALAAPLVRDEFPAVMFSATSDQRVRDSHWDLDGKICLRTDPMYKTFLAAANSYNCRCAILPLSIEDALARGLKV